MITDNGSRNTPDRMDLPFVGLATFARQTACPDWDKLDGADVAVLGVPIDTASSYRVGTRFGPRAIREVSLFHGFGPEGVFDFEDEVTYLTSDEVKIVDAGDSDVIMPTLSVVLLTQNRPCPRCAMPRRCHIFSAAITPSRWQPLPLSQTGSRSPSSISTRISTSS